MRRILILIRALLFGTPPPRKAGKLEYHPAYFLELTRVRKSLYYFDDSYQVVDTYKEMSYYRLMHMPRFFTNWKYYEFNRTLRKEYGLNMSKINLN